MIQNSQANWQSLAEILEEERRKNIYKLAGVRTPDSASADMDTSHRIGTSDRGTRVLPRKATDWTMARPDDWTNGRWPG